MTEKTKQQVIEEFKQGNTDTGSTPVQIALLTKRIKELIIHMKINKKDFSTKRGLLKLVDSRKRLLRYLERIDRPLYLNVLQQLDLRK